MADQTEAIGGLVRFTSFARLSPMDLAGLGRLLGPKRSLRRGEVLYSEGDEPPGLHLLLEGWTASSLVLENGMSQMIKVHLAGDVVGMPSLAMTRAADTVSALAPSTLSAISPKALGGLFEENPRVAALLFLISQEERVALMDRVASLGRSEAVGRLATLVLQFHARLLRQDATLKETFDIPLTQQDMAELAGLTTVHVNRILQKLRKDKIITWTRGRVQILDRKALVKLSGLPQRTLVNDPGWLPASG